MKIEAGKAYKTRNGERAFIEYEGTDGSFLGACGKSAFRLKWHKDGASYGVLRSFDLVAEWPDETIDRAQIAALDASSAFNAQAHVKLTPELDAQLNGSMLSREQAEKLRVRQEVDYWPLKAVLDEALKQASSGKGNERHANGRPFDRQPIMEHGRLTGPAGPSFQALKKIGEAQGMLARGETDAAIRELLGAIVYSAAAVQLIKEAARP